MIIGDSCGNPSSSKRFFSQQASHPASDKATYSASVDESAIVVCFLDFQVIATPEALKMYPDVDLRSLLFAKEALPYLQM